MSLGHFLVSVKVSVTMEICFACNELASEIFKIWNTQKAGFIFKRMVQQHLSDTLHGIPTGFIVGLLHKFTITTNLLYVKILSIKVWGLHHARTYSIQYLLRKKVCLQR